MMPRWQVLKDFVYGLTGYEFVHHAREMRHEAESLFLIVTFGNAIGVPVMPPIYSLRLLPLIAPKLAGWKRQLARTKELWEKQEFDLHGM